MAAVELDEPSMVLPHHLPVECGGPLECVERTGHRRGPVDRAVVKVGVAAMQHPAVAGVNGHADVAAGMPRQRDQGDARRHLVEFFRRRESPPLLPDGGVLDDLGAVRPQRGPIACASSTGRDARRSEPLGRGDVYLGVGEIGDAADVVAIEVGDDDVPTSSR